MRQTQGSMICPSCEKLIGVNEERCPFCGAWRPGLYGYTPVVQRWMTRLDFTSIMIGACAALFVLSLALQPSAIFSSGGLFNILSPGNRALFQLGSTGGAAWKLGFWWTLLTAIYLHGSLLHIFFNMMVTRNVAPAVTSAFGTARTFVIWTVAGVAGFLLSNLTSGAPTVGASGSVFGLFAALIVYGRKTHHTALTQQIWTWVIINFVIGFTISHINVIAHAGGFVGGWIAAEALSASSNRREPLGVQVVALGLLGLTIAGFVLSLIKTAPLLKFVGE